MTVVVTTTATSTSFAEELRPVLLRHGHRYHDDLLATRIFAWAAEFYEGGESVEKIEELRSKILVNPLDQAPLVDPVVDGCWVWEKWMLERFKSLCTALGKPQNAPFDGGPISERPHQLALDVLRCLQSAPLPEARQSNALIVSQRVHHLNPSSTQESNALEWANYRELAREALHRLQLEYITSCLERATVSLAERERQVTLRIDEGVQSAERRDIEHAQMFQENLSSMEVSHQREREIIQTELQAALKQSQRQQEKLAGLSQRTEFLEHELVVARARLDDVSRIARALERRPRSSCAIL
jgi:hypothetical protein